jgi:hypothetical protein
VYIEWIVEAFTFVSSYLRKRPHTYRHKDIHSTGLEPVLNHPASIQMNPQLSVIAGCIQVCKRQLKRDLFATKRISQGVCISYKNSKLVGGRKNILAFTDTAELFEMMKIFKQPFCRITQRLWSKRRRKVEAASTHSITVDDRLLDIFVEDLAAPVEPVHRRGPQNLAPDSRPGLG